MKRALITGGRGFVGRHMEAALEADGWTVRVADIADGISTAADVRRYWEFAPPPPGKVTTFDLVVHCAAVVGGITMIEGSPLELAANDLAIDAAFFDWVRRARPRHVVYFSSCAAYPARLCTRGHPRPLREADIDHAHPERPEHTYGDVKLQGERLALLVDPDDTHVHVVRPFSGYGTDQHDSYPFPAILARAMARQDPLTVWGTGEQRRDWVHIDDVIGATLALVDADLPGPMNVCTGRPITMFEMARMMADAAGYRPQIKTDTSRPASSPYRVGDPTLMRQLWIPEVTLEAGIERALAHATAAAG